MSKYDDLFDFFPLYALLFMISVLSDEKASAVAIMLVQLCCVGVAQTRQSKSLCYSTYVCTVKSYNRMIHFYLNSVIIKGNFQCPVHFATCSICGNWQLLVVSKCNYCKLNTFTQQLYDMVNLWQYHSLFEKFRKFQLIFLSLCVHMNGRDY